MEYWREELYHYAKGETAKNHKYIRKEGNRYIYADDNKNTSGVYTSRDRTDTKTAGGYSGASWAKKLTSMAATSGTSMKKVYDAFYNAMGADKSSILAVKNAILNGTATAISDETSISQNTIIYTAVSKLLENNHNMSDDQLYEAYRDLVGAVANNLPGGADILNPVAREINKTLNVKHSDANSPSISHGCLGGTAIIHRF